MNFELPRIGREAPRVSATGDSSPRNEACGRAGSTSRFGVPPLPTPRRARGTSALSTAEAGVQRVSQPSPPGNQTPSQSTYHLAGDPPPLGALPVVRPATQPAAPLSAAWPSSSAPSDTRTLQRWSG